MEEEKTPSAAAKKILAALRTFATKTNSSLGAGAVEAAFKRLGALAEEAADDDDRAEFSKTPKRDVGAGGSVRGRKNLKVRRFCSG